MELAAADGAWPEVRENAERSLAVNPLVPGPYRQLARAAAAMGDDSAAVFAWRTLLELDVPEEERERAPAAASRNPEADKRAQEKEDLRRHIELEYRARLYKAIVGKWKGPLKRAELEQLYAIIMDYTSVSDELLAEAFGGKIPDPKKASEADVVRLIFAVMFSGHEIESTYNKPGHLLDYAGRLKIDAKKIRAEVTKDLAPKPEPAAAKGKKK
jgi:hypothetical protein